MFTLIAFIKTFLKSCSRKHKHGTSIKVTNVEKSTPKDNETAIGIINFAWRLVSKITGIKPTNVVIDVIIIALNLRQLTSMVALIMFVP